MNGPVLPHYGDLLSRWGEMVISPWQLITSPRQDKIVFSYGAHWVLYIHDLGNLISLGIIATNNQLVCQI